MKKGLLCAVLLLGLPLSALADDKLVAHQKVQISKQYVLWGKSIYWRDGTHCTLFHKEAVCIKGDKIDSSKQS